MGDSLLCSPRFPEPRFFVAPPFFFSSFIKDPFQLVVLVALAFSYSQHSISYQSGNMSTKVLLTALHLLLMFWSCKPHFPQICFTLFQGAINLVCHVELVNFAIRSSFNVCIYSSFYHGLCWMLHQLPTMKESPISQPLTVFVYRCFFVWFLPRIGFSHSGSIISLF